MSRDPMKNDPEHKSIHYLASAILTCDSPPRETGKVSTVKQFFSPQLVKY